MLEGLDTVDWSSLTHAYGAATDVPNVLRCLVDGDEEAHQEALETIHSNIWHQGTVYSATSVAVPFLVELAEEPATRSRETIVFLLGLIARGTTYPQLREASSLPDPRRGTPEWEVMKARDLATIASVRAAMAAVWPRIIRLLRDDNKEVRAAVPFVLSAIPEHMDEARRTLEAALSEEPEERGRSAMLLALGDLNTMTVSLWQRIQSSGQSELERFAAAIAIARTATAECPAEAIDVIIEGVRNAKTLDVVWGRIPRESRGASSEAMRAFEMMQPPAAELAVERLLHVLPFMGEFGTASGVRALLRLTFRETGALPFSDRQRAVLLAIASADAAWTPGGELVTVRRYLQSHGLPDDREALAALVQT